MFGTEGRQTKDAWKMLQLTRQQLESRWTGVPAREAFTTGGQPAPETTHPPPASGQPAPCLILAQHRRSGGRTPSLPGSLFRVSFPASVLPARGTYNLPVFTWVELLQVTSRKSLSPVGQPLTATFLLMTLQGLSLFFLAPWASEMPFDPY